MVYVWTLFAIMIASLGHLVGIDVGLIWSLAVAAVLGVISVYYRIKPGRQPLDRINWAQLGAVVLGGLILGLFLRWFFLGSLNLLTNILPA